MRGFATATTAPAASIIAWIAAGCAGGPTPPETPPAPVTAMASEAPSAAPVAEPPAATPAPRTPADCRELLSDVINDPPSSGVPLNNAMTIKDAGGGDRIEPLTELIKSRRDGFRCCFDQWAREHPGAEGAMKMVIELKKDGEVMRISFAPTARRIEVPEVEACMSDLAKSLRYPKSPSGKETRFTYPFDFKSRR